MKPSLQFPLVPHFDIDPFVQRQFDEIKGLLYGCSGTGSESLKTCCNLHDDIRFFAFFIWLLTKKNSRQIDVVVIRGVVVVILWYYVQLWEIGKRTSCKELTSIFHLYPILFFQNNVSSKLSRNIIWYFSKLFKIKKMKKSYEVSH